MPVSEGNNSSYSPFQKQGTVSASCRRSGGLAGALGRGNLEGIFLLARQSACFHFAAGRDFAPEGMLALDSAVAATTGDDAGCLDLISSKAAAVELGGASVGWDVEPVPGVTLFDSRRSMISRARTTAPATRISLRIQIEVRPGDRSLIALKPRRTIFAVTS